MKTKEKILIKSTSIITNGGSSVATLLKNMNDKTCGIKYSTSFKMDTDPIYIAQIEKYNGKSIKERVQDMLLTTFSKILPNIPLEKKALVYMVLPEKELARSKIITEKLITETLKTYAENFGYKNLFFRFNYTSCYICKGLKELIDKLENKEYDFLIFAGVDSLINTETANELSKINWLMTRKNMFGFALGEACVFVLLKKEINNDNLAYISSISSSFEKYPLLDNKGPKTLINAIKSLEENISSKDINNVILSLENKRNGLIEWYKTSQKIWPSKNYETPNTISLSILGEIGACSIPLSVAIASSSLGINLICKADEYEPKEAIIIKNQIGEK